MAYYIIQMKFNKKTIFRCDDENIAEKARKRGHRVVRVLSTYGFSQLPRIVAYR